MSSRLAPDNLGPDRLSSISFRIWRGKVDAHWRESDGPRSSSTKTFFRLNQTTIMKFDGIDAMPIEGDDNVIVVGKADRSKYVKAFCVYNGRSESSYTTGRLNHFIVIILSLVFCGLLLSAIGEWPKEIFLPVVSVFFIPAVIATLLLARIYLARSILKRELKSLDLQYIAG